jgi:toxin HigB-1
VIIGYRDRETARFAEGDDVRRFSGFADVARKRLRILEAVTSINDLRALPSNRFEALRGDRTGQFSIRINLQWRLCFVWPAGTTGPDQVEIVDYH